MATAITLAPTTAHAVGDDTTRTPTADATFSTGETVVFENRTHPDWQVPEVVNDYDRRFAALELLVDSCADHPDAACVLVEGTNRPGAWWWGYWTNTSETDGHIVVNRAHGRDPYVACHEVGHALGLNHHRRGPGCLKVGDYSSGRASNWEINALREAYANDDGSQEDFPATSAVPAKP